MAVENGEYELLPHLGDMDPVDQWHVLRAGYVERGLLRATNRSAMGSRERLDERHGGGYSSKDALTDMEIMRRTALTGQMQDLRKYVRADDTPSVRLPVGINGQVEPEDVFDDLEASDGVTRYNLLFRLIGQDRLVKARLEGVDRDDESPFIGSGAFERQAMREYALRGAGRFMYAMAAERESRQVNIRGGDMLLVYAPQAWQEIAPRDKPMAPPKAGVYAYVDQRLVRNSLLGYALRQDAAQHVSGVSVTSEGFAATDRIVSAG